MTRPAGSTTRNASWPRSGLDSIGAGSRPSIREAPMRVVDVVHHQIESSRSRGRLFLPQQQQMRSTAAR